MPKQSKMEITDCPLLLNLYSVFRKGQPISLLYYSHMTLQSCPLLSHHWWCNLLWSYFVTFCGAGYEWRSRPLNFWKWQYSLWKINPYPEIGDTKYVVKFLFLSCTVCTVNFGIRASGFISTSKKCLAKEIPGRRSVWGQSCAHILSIQLTSSIFPNICSLFWTSWCNFCIRF